MFLLGSCCFWPFSGSVIPRIAGGIQHWTDLITLEHTPAAALGAGVITTMVGGMALVAIGVGLTGERRYSGTAAMFIALAMALVYLVEIKGVP